MATLTPFALPGPSADYVLFHHVFEKFLRVLFSFLCLTSSTNYHPLLGLAVSSTHPRVMIRRAQAMQPAPCHDTFVLHHY